MARGITTAAAAVTGVGGIIGVVDFCVHVALQRNHDMCMNCFVFTVLSRSAASRQRQQWALQLYVLQLHSIAMLPADNKGVGVEHSDRKGTSSSKFHVQFGKTAKKITLHKFGQRVDECFVGGRIKARGQESLRRSRPISFMRNSYKEEMVLLS